MNKRQRKKIEKQKILQSYHLRPRDARKKYKEDKQLIDKYGSVYLQILHLENELKSVNIVELFNEEVQRWRNEHSEEINLRHSIINRLSTYDLTLAECLSLNHTIDSLNDCLNAVDDILEQYDMNSYSKGKLLGVKKISDYLSVDIQKNIIDTTYKVFRENILDGNRSSKAIATLLSIEINNLLMNTVDVYHEQMTESIRQEIDNAAYYISGNSSEFWTADDE